MFINHYIHTVLYCYRDVSYIIQSCKMAVVCSEVKEDYFLATIGAVFDDGEEEEDVGHIQELESGG